MSQKYLDELGMYTPTQ